MIDWPHGFIADLVLVQWQQSTSQTLKPELLFGTDVLSFISLNKTVGWRPNGESLRTSGTMRWLTHSQHSLFSRTDELTFVFGLFGETNLFKTKHLLTWCLITSPRLATVLKILLITYIFSYFCSVRICNFPTFWTPLFDWNMHNKCLVFVQVNPTYWLHHHHR